jgi:small-conductance mechanosensitive channel
MAPILTGWGFFMTGGKTNQRNTLMTTKTKDMILSIVVCAGITAGLFSPIPSISNLAVFFMSALGTLNLVLALLLVAVLVIYPRLTFQQRIDAAIRFRDIASSKVRRILAYIFGVILILSAVLTGHIGLALFYTVAFCMIRVMIYLVHDIICEDVV